MRFVVVLTVRVRKGFVYKRDLLLISRLKVIVCLETKGRICIPPMLPNLIASSNPVGEQRN